MKHLRSLLLVGLVGMMLFSLTGCPGKEGTLFKSYVTRFGKPPKISVYLKESGKKVEMDLEEYLVGVVAGEMKPGWSLNAYAAQAIIARTFTMEFLSRGGTRKLHGTDISNDENEAQNYNAAAITPIMRKAVEMTKGQVLTYKEKYIKAWYGTICGGHTTYAKEGLAYPGQEPPYITPVKCPEEKVIPKEELFWDSTLTTADATSALKAMNKNIGNLQKIEVTKRSKTTYRATELRLTGDQGNLIMAGADFRINFGPEKVRSIWLLDIENKPNAVKLSGRGFGHGVGLCQWGAYALAKQGRSPKEIVKHYYPKAHLSKVW